MSSVFLCLPSQVSHKPMRRSLPWLSSAFCLRACPYIPLLLCSSPSSSSHPRGPRFTHFSLFPAGVIKHSERNPAAWVGTMASKKKKNGTVILRAKDCTFKACMEYR